jgi:uncharacterized membrane protein
MDIKPNNVTVDDSHKERGFVLETFFQGFINLLPILFILVVFSLILNFVFGIVEPLSNLLEVGKDEPRWWIKLISLFILLLLIFGIGLFVSDRKGRQRFRYFERKYFWKLPLYNIAHQTVTKFVDMKDMPFSQVVLFDPYKTGTLMTGFVTDKINDELFTIFVPTAPNPMNGNIYHAPKTSLVFLTISSQVAMRSIMGMGTGSGDMFKGMKVKEVKEEEVIIEPANGKVPSNSNGKLDPKFSDVNSQVNLTD